MSLSLEEIFAFRAVSDVQLSPDGRRFAFVVGDNHTTLLELEGRYVCPSLPSLCRGAMFTREERGQRWQ